jgi:hypothetical protein
MRWVFIVVIPLTIVGVAAMGFNLAQNGSTSTARPASTASIAPVSQEVSALPGHVPVNQITKATGSAASPLILPANAEALNPTTMVTQAPSAAAAAAPKIKYQSFGPGSISKAIAAETRRLKNDATGWAERLQKLMLTLKLQDLELDPTKNQDVEAKGKDIDDCLGVLREAASRLAPDVETGATLRKQEVAIRDLAIRAEVHPDSEIRKSADFFQQKTAEMRTLNRSVEEIRTRLVTQIDRLEELKVRLVFNRTVAQIDEALNDAEVSLDNIQAIAEDAGRIAADLYGFGGASAVIIELPEAAKAVEVKKPPAASADENIGGAIDD